MSPETSVYFTQATCDVDVNARASIEYGLASGITSPPLTLLLLLG